MLLRHDGSACGCKVARQPSYGKCSVKVPLSRQTKSSTLVRASRIPLIAPLLALFANAAGGQQIYTPSTYNNGELEIQDAMDSAGVPLSSPNQIQFLLSPPPI